MPVTFISIHPREDKVDVVSRKLETSHGVTFMISFQIGYATDVTLTGVTKDLALRIAQVATELAVQIEAEQKQKEVAESAATRQFS